MLQAPRTLKTRESQIARKYEISVIVTCVLISNPVVEIDRTNYKLLYPRR
jgi:hypothetical protein